MHTAIADDSTPTNLPEREIGHEYSCRIPSCLASILHFKLNHRVEYMEKTLKMESIESCIFDSRLASTFYLSEPNSVWAEDRSKSVCVYT